MKRPPRGDLRVDKTPDPSKSQVDLFTELPVGDIWKDADVIPAFNYLFERTRTNCWGLGSLWIKQNPDCLCTGLIRMKAFNLPSNLYTCSGVGT